MLVVVAVFIGVSNPKSLAPALALDVSGLAQFVRSFDTPLLLHLADATRQAGLLVQAADAGRKSYTGAILTKHIHHSREVRALHSGGIL